eukprot:SAG22_NODE_3377_length_1746_cov_1.840316_1_plen_190_part_00
MAAHITKAMGEAEDEDKLMLDLSWGEIDDAALSTLTAVMSDKGYTQIWLNNNKLTDAGAVELATAAKASPSLSKLWLNGNQIGDAGLTALAAALPESGLEEFWSIGNAHGDAGVIAVAGAVPKTKLQTLWLWGNSVGDAGVKALCEALSSKDTNIFEIGMGACAPPCSRAPPPRSVCPPSPPLLERCRE